MDNALRQLITNKLGSLMLANAELQASAATLAAAVKQRDVEIADLKAQLANVTAQLAGATEDLPANRYAEEHKGTLQ